MTSLFHLLAPEIWAQVGEDYRPASLAAEGFIHFSFAEQVAGVANARYGDAPRLCALEVDPARLDAPVVVEDSYASGTEYPHLYGPLPRKAVIAVHDVPRTADGQFSFAAVGPSSPDR